MSGVKGSNGLRRIAIMSEATASRGRPPKASAIPWENRTRADRIYPDGRSFNSAVHVRTKERTAAVVGHRADESNRGTPAA